MMKRVTWFVGGVAAGAVGMTAAKKKVTRVANDLAPVQVAKRATGNVRSGGHVRIRRSFRRRMFTAAIFASLPMRIMLG